MWLHLKNHETSLILRKILCNLCAKFYNPFRISGELNSSVIHDFSTHEVFTSTKTSATPQC